MPWHSAAQFWAMGGYALYVWGSLGACAAGMVIEPLLLAQRRRRIMSLLRREKLARQLDKVATSAASDAASTASSPEASPAASQRSRT